MWSSKTSRNYAQVTEDMKNLARHKQAIQSIQRKGSGTLKCTNPEWIEKKMRYQSDYKIRVQEQKIYEHNLKIDDKIDEIYRRPGEYNQTVLRKFDYLSKGTMGFKPKTLDQMIKENMQY